MSDRVAIIGGSAVGRDHFPYPTRVYDYTGPVGDGELYTVTPALSHACKWFYVARVWTLAFTLSLQQRKLPPHDTEFQTRIYTVSFDFELLVDTNTDPEADANYVLPTKESDLLWPRGTEDFDDFLTFGSGGAFGGTGKINVTNYSFSDTGAGTFSDDIEFALGFWFTAPVWNTGNIGELLVFAGGTRGRQFTTFYNDPGAAGATDEYGFITLDSAYSVPIQCDPDEDSDIHFGSPMSATLNPKSFWPYATKPTETDPAGLPVYDTSTGAQLRDPFS